MNAPLSLDFTIERRAGIDVVVFANDSCRPAMETEVAMWNRLADSTKPITHVVVAETEEFGIVACGYSGSPDEIARAVMAKACAQGYSGTYQDRLAELGWRVEPVYLPGQPATSADTALLDTIQRNHWKVAPVDLPTGLGDADVGWRVIEEDMTAPSGRRVVHEHATDDVRAALRYAIDATNSIAGED